VNAAGAGGTVTELQAQRFEQIGVDALVRAERESCDHDEFVEGLRIIKAQVDERLAFAEIEAGSEVTAGSSAL
jgi:hypothetical protein